MQILNIIKTIIANKEKIKQISNTVIRVIDALDGKQDWEKKEK